MATPHSLLRRLTLSILLPMVLLFSQQGALLHELSHWHVVPASVSAAASGPQAQAVDIDNDFCLSCLGFAQIGGLAKFDALPTLELDSLSYHFAADAVRHVAELALPVARSRGPPPSF